MRAEVHCSPVSALCGIPLFNTLQEWRSHKAREEGVPTYFVRTNKLQHNF